MKNNTALYLDDVRIPSTTLPGYEPWVVVKNYEEFVQHIETHGIPALISFDHDLADEHMADFFDKQARGVQVISYDKYQEKTGLDCLKWLIDLVLDQTQDGKDVEPFEVRVHSHNPMGAENIMVMAQNFIQHMQWPVPVVYYRTPFIIETKIEE